MARVHLVDALAVLFGIGTWVCVNALWVELPLLVPKLPEGWKLPSYLSVTIQIANIGPIVYSLLNNVFPKVVTEKRAIYLSMTVETVSAILLAFLWQETGYVFGDSHAVGLLSLAFFFALVDCSSRVLFLPFMARFQSIYLMPYFIGEGLSSFIPSILALIQGVGGNPECNLVPKSNETAEWKEWVAIYGEPLFSVQTFFIVVFGVMIVSIFAFHLLNYKSLVHNALAQTQILGTGTPVDELLNAKGRRNSHTSYQSTSPSNSLKSLKGKEIETELDGKDSPDSERRLPHGISTIMTPNNNNSALSVEIVATDETLFRQVSKQLFITLLIVQGIICSLSNGVFPSIQSYSCLPYGNVAYHWAVILSSMTNPIVCFMAMALPKPTQTSILSVAALALGVSAYAFTTAIESPHPPLVGQISGEALLIMSWVLLVGLFTYVRISIATILRAEGRRGLFICGAVTQIGSATGALVTFFVVNFTETFESYQACSEGPVPV